LHYSGKLREARSRYATAVLLQPDFPDALTALAWLLATSTEVEFRNGPEAVRMAERACELTARKDASKLKALAAAYAETGRFAEAQAAVRIAKSLAAGRKELMNECELMSEAFESGHPWRQVTAGK
jgi:Flp pilus assembly protein TadD